MVLSRDTFYHFTLRFDFGEDRIDLYLHVKMTGDHFVVKLGNGRREVRKDSKADLDALTAELFDIVRSYAEGRFKRFLRGESSTLGFKTE